MPVVCHTKHEDYTAGEVTLNRLPDALDTCPGRWIRRDGGKAQYHVLSFLGTSWCKGDKPQLPDRQIIAYTRRLADREMGTQSRMPPPRYTRGERFDTRPDVGKGTSLSGSSRGDRLYYASSGVSAHHSPTFPCTS